MVNSGSEEVEGEYIAPNEPLPNRLSPAERRTLQQMAKWMDTVFTIPGTGFRFGVDALIGLLPGFGDTVMLFIQFYPLFVAKKNHASSSLLLRMTGRILVDAITGLVPILGDLFDAHYKATYRNVQDMLREFSAGQPLA